MDVSGPLALIAVVVSGWASGRIEKTMEGAAWGKIAAGMTTGVVVGAAAGAWWNQAKAGDGWFEVAVLCAAYYIVRLYIYPVGYNHQNAERYDRAVFEAVESGDDNRRRNATAKVGADIDAIVQWAKKHEENRYRYRRWARGEGPAGLRGDLDVMPGERAAGECAVALLDLMGDRRWARVIARDGGWLARRVVQACRKHQAWGVNIGRMLHAVTMEAIREPESFIKQETAYMAGSRMIASQQPVMETIYGPDGPIGMEAGRWIRPEHEEARRWGEEERERWSTVAEKVAESWTRADGLWTNPDIVKQIGIGLETVRTTESWSVADNDIEAQWTAVERQARRLDQVTFAIAGRYDGMKAASEHTSPGETAIETAAEELSREATEIIRQASLMADKRERGGTIRKYWIWIGIMSGSWINTPAHDALREKIAERVGAALEKDIAMLWETGHAFLHARIVNLVLVATAGRMGLEIREGKEGKAGRSVVEKVHEGIRGRYPWLERQHPHEAQAMLCPHVTRGMEELVVRVQNMFGHWLETRIPFNEVESCGDTNDPNFTGRG